MQQHDPAPRSMASGVPLTPGALLDARYEILQYIGEGGMGVVYKARDTVLDEVVAIKVLRPALLDTPSIRQRFLSESKLARKVSHRNVCRIHDYGEDGPIGYISMQFVEGIELKTLVRQAPGLSVSEAFEIGIQLADGLQAIHDEGIVHRDFKCANVVVDRRGHARLMDFGIAKLWDVSGAAGLTLDGTVTGTPDYMSPEQAAGEAIDPRSDIYALGIVLFELFTGVRPFTGDSVASVLHQQRFAEPPLESDVAARIPASVKPIIRKALAKAREDRYATADDVRRALVDAREAVERGASDATRTLIQRVDDVHATPESAASLAAHDAPEHRTSTSPRRRRAAALIAVAVVVVVAAGGTLAFRALRALPTPSSEQTAAVGAPANAPRATSAETPSAPSPGVASEAHKDAPSAEPGIHPPLAPPAGKDSPEPTTADSKVPEQVSSPVGCQPGELTPCQKACDAGQAAACTEVGLMYNVGGSGAGQDFVTAADYYERGCRGGDMRGCSNLGTLYQFGALGFRNRARAIVLYEQACTAGEMEGCANLGKLYEDPGSSAREHALARDLLRKACAAGVSRACG